MVGQHDEISELLGAYALDAVDAEERQRIEDHLTDCPRCRAEVSDHREVAAMMAHSGGDAPEGVWGRILESLEEPAPELRMPSELVAPRDVAPPAPVATDELAERRAHRTRSPILLGAVAAALLVIGLIAGTVVAGDSDPAPPEVAASSLETLARDALNDPDARRVDLASPLDGDVAATAAVETDGSGYLLGAALPALDESRTYQLWGVSGDNVISLGLLGSSPSVIAFHADPGTDQLVITEEVAGGVPSSENPALFAGALS